MALLGLAMVIFDEDQSTILPKIERGLPAMRDAGVAELAIYQDSVLEGITFATDRNAWKELAAVIEPYQR
ncbi:MAG: hypothetical protein V1800_02095 [Candidatus Latescibacterota bacterium]